MRETLKAMIQVQTLKDEGLTNVAIGQRLRIHRETVAAYLTKMQQARDEGRPIDDVVTRRSRRSMMEPFLNHIRERLSDYP
ncbi:hypothetical protein SAMN04489725_1338, partial [Alicyclobacillus hesperidum]